MHIICVLLIVDGRKSLDMVLQTRLTALDLIGYAAGDERPRQFVHMPEQELDQELVSIKVRFFYTSAVYCTPMMPQRQGSSCA